VQRFYADKLSAGLAPRTVHHCHAVLHRALEQAVRWNRIPRNLSDAVDAPRVPRREMPVPTPAELVRLIRHGGAARGPAGRAVKHGGLYGLPQG
jgi:integrase